jgi:DNA-binding protein HU-beta
MNKRDLAIEVTRKVEGMSEAAATRAIDAVFGSIGGALESGEKVGIKGFGTFTVRGRKGRNGRNPQTGKAMKINPSKAVHFKPGLNIKKAVNGN